MRATSSARPHVSRTAALSIFPTSVIGRGVLDSCQSDGISKRASRSRANAASSSAVVAEPETSCTAAAACSRSPVTAALADDGLERLAQRTWQGGMTRRPIDVGEQDAVPHRHQPGRGRRVLGPRRRRTGSGQLGVMTTFSASFAAAFLKTS